MLIEKNPLAREAASRVTKMKGAAPNSALLGTCSQKHLLTEDMSSLSSVARAPKQLS